jgi:hypothetical protein
MRASSMPRTTSNTNTLDGIRGQYLSHWQTAQYDSMSLAPQRKPNKYGCPSPQFGYLMDLSTT